MLEPRSRDGPENRGSASSLPASLSLPSLPTTSLPATAQSSSSSPGGATLGGMWQSLIAPIKKFWEVPVIHVSTYYGTANQLGRPGPVLAILVERSAVLRSRAKQRIKRQQQQQKLLAAAAAASSLSSLASLPLGGTPTVSNGTTQHHPASAAAAAAAAAPGAVSSTATRTMDGVSSSTSSSPVGIALASSNSAIPSSSSSTASMPPIPPASSPSADDGGGSVEIEGVLLVTPRSIERYHLNGTPVKRAAIPDTITAFSGGKIAGVGRVFICGTQSGRLHVLKTNLLDAMLVFDTGCLNAKFITSSRKTATTERCTASAFRSQLSFASDAVSQSPSVFADPPRLLAEAVVMAAAATPGSHDAGNLADIDLPPDVVHRLGTTTGDGITPALLEGRASILHRRQIRGAIKIDAPLVDDVMDRLASTVGKSPSSSTLLTQQSDPSVGSGLPTAPSGLLSKVFEKQQTSSFFATRCRDMLDTLCEAMKYQAEICSIATKCSFSNFCEMILAGTLRGEIFGWEVPSGRLTFAFPFPCNDKSASFVAAMQTVNVGGTANYLWAGYGSGQLAVFNLKLGTLEHLLEVPGNEPIVSIEVATQLAVILVLSGNSRLTIWSCNNTPKLLATYNTSHLTGGVPLSCFKAVEPTRRGYTATCAVLFLGCTDGSLSVHKLSWKGHPIHMPSIFSHGPRLRPLSGFVDDISAAPANTVEYSSWGDSPPVLECKLLKSFVREIEPKCPVSAICVDPAIDTVFIGDASGVVATLIPIRYLLQGSGNSSEPFVPSLSRSCQYTMRLLARTIKSMMHLVILLAICMIVSATRPDKTPCGEYDSGFVVDTLYYSNHRVQRISRCVEQDALAKNTLEGAGHTSPKPSKLPRSLPRLLDLPFDTLKALATSVVTKPLNLLPDTSDLTGGVLGPLALQVLLPHESPAPSLNANNQGIRVAQTHVSVLSFGKNRTMSPSLSIEGGVGNYMNSSGSQHLVVHTSGS